MEYLDSYNSSLGEDESTPSLLHPDRYDHDHISNLEVFSQDLQKAITNSFPRPKTSYVSVNVLLLRWTEDDLNVQQELTALKSVFENQYRFVTEQWHIPSKNSTRALQTKLYDFQNFHQSEDELLIVYYAGHGDPDRRGRSIWAANKKPDSPTLNWSSLQHLLETAIPKVLIILDCCYAANAARDTSEGTTKELLAACGRENPTMGVCNRSFSCALIEELQAFGNRPFTAAMLHGRLITMRWRLAYTPVHALLSEHGGHSIELCPQEPQLPPAGPGIPPDSFISDTCDDMMDISPASVAADTRVLLAVSITDNAICNIVEWKEWLISQAPWDITSIEVKVEAVYKSHSTMLITSLPVVAWDLLPNKAAYRFIGFVKSEPFDEGQQKVDSSAIDYQSPSMSEQAMGPGIKPEDPSTLGYESADEIDASKYQVAWTNVMAEGRYLSPSVYKKAEVLLLCWKEHCSDLDTKTEVSQLVSVLEVGFGYGVTIVHLDGNEKNRLQVQLNAKVAGFVDTHDGPDTLLIVYYAGHGKPDKYFGDLEMFGQTSRNDPRDVKTRQRNLLVWNKTEELLRPAGADVLKIFDCCYAGTLGLPRGENRFRIPGSLPSAADGVRLFEYLAAARDQGTTEVPGPKSFTSALIFALEALKNEKPESRFTTDELLRKIKTEAPHFPKDQTPVLSDREHKKPTGGRIMLHPIRTDRVDINKAPEVPPVDQGNGHFVTLHFDFGDKPSEHELITLGQGLKEFFERSTLRVHRVRWGGMRRTMFGLATRRLRGSLRKRRVLAFEPSSTELLSPQTAESDFQDFMTTGSYSPSASSAPTPDM
ncbi:MAG: hypothetical protein Q9226_007070 [Calogaya cf. arnoldii]